MRARTLNQIMKRYAPGKVGVSPKHGGYVFVPVVYDHEDNRYWGYVQYTDIDYPYLTFRDAGEAKYYVVKENVRKPSKAYIVHKLLRDIALSLMGGSAA